MSTDARPPAPPAVADQPGPAAPKRLPGLWVVCVLFGLAGAFTGSLVFFATAAGVLFFTGVGIVHLVAALGLWKRLPAAWVGAIVLLALKLIFWSASSLTDWPDSAGAAAVPVAINLGILAYLLLRRQYFARGVPSRPIKDASGIVAALVVLLPAVCWTLLATVDDAREEFPELEVDLSPPPPEQNAFLVIERMRTVAPKEKKIVREEGERFYEEQDELSWLLANAPGKAEPVPEGWATRAERFLAAQAAALEMIDDALGRPRFAPPVPSSGMEWFTRDMWWLPFVRRTARILTVSSDLHILRQEEGLALDDARRAVEMGLLIVREPDSFISYLAAVAVLQLGLAQMQEVTDAATDPTDLLQSMPKPDMESDLGDGIRRAIGLELRATDEMMEELRRMSPSELAAVGGGLDKKPRWAEQFIAAIPFIKPNMTHNLIGRYHAALVAQTYRYDPSMQRPEWVTVGLREVARRLGWLHLARNPIGDILIVMLEPALSRTPEIHFGTVAQLRLTRIHMALRCYQLEHGKLPEKLDELAPGYLKAIPVDPFTGKAFGYEPGGARPRLWSVGPDQVPGQSREEGGDDVVVPLAFAEG